jgi:hypothetical protein
MKKLKHLLILVFCLTVIISCKKNDDYSELTRNSQRIKQIIEYNEAGNENQRILFGYKSDKLISWQQFSTNENGEINESEKVTISYEGNNVAVSLFNKNNDNWNLYREEDYKILNNLVQEEIVSRHSAHPCIGCWKYSYSYSGNRLIGWVKYIKNEGDSWEQCRRVEYNYKDNKLTDHKDYVNCSDSELKLDYLRKYFYTNEKVAGWQGGTYRNGYEWKPTQQIEYTYVNNNISAKTYSVWDNTLNAWKYFGSMNYFYDKKGYLIEETTSRGERTLYEYEPGNGNASLFYYEADGLAQNEPTCKSAIALKALFNRQKK